jgi:hypothetical protein
MLNLYTLLQQIFIHYIKEFAHSLLRGAKRLLQYNILLLHFIKTVPYTCTWTGLYLLKRHYFDVQYGIMCSIEKMLFWERVSLLCT